MNLRELEYLVALDELRHFGKAAASCNVSQPTLSGQLKKLETYLDMQLVERGNREVFLTEAGSEVVRLARNVLKGVREIESYAQSLGDPMTGNLRVGLIPTVAPYLLPLFVKEVHTQWPDLDMKLREGQTSELVNLLRIGELDVAILALGVPGTEGFEALRLYQEPFVLAVPLEHPLADRSNVSQDDLGQQSLLLLEEGHCLRGQALDVCFTHGAREADGFRATSLETLRHMVASGAGVTLVPQLAVPETGPTKISYLPFEAPVPGREIGLLYRGNTGRLTCFRNLAALIREQVAPRIAEATRAP